MTQRGFIVSDFVLPVVFVLAADLELAKLFCDPIDPCLTVGLTDLGRPAWAVTVDSEPSREYVGDGARVADDA